jgi:hypothetical protein
MQDILSDIKSKRHIYFATGCLCFLLLLVLAVVFYRERVIFSDTAFQLVHLLIEQKPLVMPVRFGAGLSQLIPLTAIWLHCGLSTVMIVHSISSLLLYLLLFFIAYRYSQRQFMFFIIPLNLVLIANDVFFWPVSDVQLGLVWLCFYATFLFEGYWQGKKWYWPIHFIFILWVQIFHLLVFLPILLLIVYYYDSISQLFSRKFLVHSGICIIAFIIRLIVAQNNLYERSKTNIFRNLRIHLPHLFSLHSVQDFAHKILTVYAIYAIALPASIIWLAYTGYYKRAAAVTLFSLGQWLMVIVTAADDTGFYLENMLLPIGFMAALPIVADMIPASKKSWAIVFVLFIAIRVGFISHTDTTFQNRLAMYAPYYQYVKEKALKGVFIKSNLVGKKYILTWGTGYESMLLSALASPDSCMIVQIDDDASRFGFARQADSSFVLDFDIWGRASVPERYFRLPKGGYEIITDSSQLRK